ncbi:MAG: lipopolysaccharide biosynthesis protein, partial [Burkholderiaceae bacterium]
AAIWVLLLPFFVVLALLAPDVIALLYGRAWSDAAPVLALLFLAMPAFVTWGMSTPVLWNTGRARQEVLLQLPLLPIAALAFYAFARDSVLAAAAVAGLVLIARGAVMAVAASRILRVPATAWLGWLVRGIALSVLLGGLVALLVHLLPAGLPALARLLLPGVAALAVAGAVVALAPGLLGRDAMQLLLRFAPGLNRWLDRR